jgi:putative nucleotidyltransferase with HDIG domain
MQILSSSPPASRLNRSQIEAKVRVCRPLPSLHSISQSLRALLSMDHCYTSQISDVIRRDPSLSTRILQVVNSAYFGLSEPVRRVEDAVFYLGLEHIRQVALITPIIEDFQKLCGQTPYDWRGFWQHCVGTAILTSEITGLTGRPRDEVNYVAGLLHDVGKIVMAAVFPKHFADVLQCAKEVVQDLTEVESYVLGVDHTELGAIYLQSHRVPEVFVEAARSHHQPDQATEHLEMVAAVHVADLLIRHAGIGASGNPKEVTLSECLEAASWKALLPQADETALASAHERLTQTIEQLPRILDRLV